MPVTGRGPGALVRRAIAKLIWPFLRHQVDLNHVLVAEVRDLQAKQDVLLATVEQQLSARGHFTMALRQVGDQVDFVEDGLHNVERALHILEEQYTFVVQLRESHLADVQSHLADVQSHLTARTQQLENQIDLGHRQVLARFYDGFGALQRDLSELAHQLSDLASKTSSDELARVLARLAEVDHFVTEVKRSYPELVKPERLVRLATGFDAVSRAHAQRFRGTFEEVKQRVSVYVPELKAASALGRVLDIGCGGGELLTVLQENDIDAYGIEVLESAVEECVAAGLEVREDDALHHLATVPKGSLGAVTAIHVAEHLGFDSLMEMIDLSLQALAPGGVIILETPNPANVKVGAGSFYIDPTHDHPIPSELLEFLVSIRGFTDAHVVPLRRSGEVFDVVMPTEGAWANDVSRVAQHVSNVLLGAEDYAVVARRAS
jgi:O-antigen chain-terminating methyltransferase